MCWDIYDDSYWGSVNVVGGSEQAHRDGLAVGSIGCGVITREAVRICVLFSITIRVTRVCSVARNVFTALMKEDGGAVSK